MNNNTQDVDALGLFRKQLFGFVVGAVIALLIIASLVALIMLSTNAPQVPSVPIPDLLVWAGIAGFFGGAARAMYCFIVQLNCRDNEEVNWRLHRWF